MHVDKEYCAKMSWYYKIIGWGELQSINLCLPGWETVYEARLEECLVFQQAFGALAAAGTMEGAVAALLSETARQRALREMAAARQVLAAAIVLRYGAGQPNAASYALTRVGR